MLIAEEFLLLCLDEKSGRRRVGMDRINPALAGALLVELALRERIGVTADEEGWNRRRRAVLVSATPTDDAELDRALQAVAAHEGRRVSDLVSNSSGRRLSKGLRDRLLQRLAHAGVLSHHRGTVLGFIPDITWPVQDRSALDEVRRRLHAALVAREVPTERTVALVSLLHGARILGKVLDVADPKAVKERAAELSAGDWAARAVKQAIDEAGAAGAV